MIVFGGLLTSRMSSTPPANMNTTTTQTDQIQVTNGVKHLVPLDKIVSGGPPKDGIPSIDNPRFVSSEEAEEFLSDYKVVLGVSIDGISRAYPVQVLAWHEIVNDEFDGRPILVTFCPLCFTGAVFERVIDGEPVEFGTSGKLYNSDLVMYDRKTDSYWSQILGKAIAGELTGYELKRVPMDQVPWKVWKSLHPDTQVLSGEIGGVGLYGADPYESYYTNPNIVFPVENQDDRLGPKELTYGLVILGEAKAYKVGAMQNVVINDQLAGSEILVHGVGGVIRSFDRKVDGVTLEFILAGGKILDVQTNSEWNIDGEAVAGVYKGKRLQKVVGTINFWFAWAAFYPDTELYTRG